MTQATSIIPVISSRRRFLAAAAGGSAISVGSLVVGSIRIPAAVSCAPTLSVMSDLTPKDVLTDLFGGADFDHEILNPAEAARIVLDRLRDAGFEIVPAGKAVLS
jgi:hypothetical protein